MIRMNKLEMLLNEQEMLMDGYVNNKHYQTRLSKLSAQISDEYAKENGLPTINEQERQAYQKQEKIKYSLFGIQTTISMLTTEHINQLSEKELKIVLARVNDLYHEIMKNENLTKEERENLHKQYLELKTKLNEPISFEFKEPVLIKPRISVMNGYNEKNISGALKSLDLLHDVDVEAYNDIIQALQVVKFSKRQLIAIGQAIHQERIDKEYSKDYSLAVQKIVKVLNEKNVWKMERVNFF